MEKIGVSSWVLEEIGGLKSAITLKVIILILIPGMPGVNHAKFHRKSYSKIY